MIAAAGTGFRDQVFLQSNDHNKNVKYSYKFFHMKVIKTKWITEISLSIVLSVDFFEIHVYQY